MPCKSNVFPQPPIGSPAWPELYPVQWSEYPDGPSIHHLTEPRRPSSSRGAAPPVLPIFPERSEITASCFSQHSTSSGTDGSFPRGFEQRWPACTGQYGAQSHDSYMHQISYGTSPFGMNENMTSHPPCFLLRSKKCQKVFWPPWVPPDRLSQQIEFLGVTNYARHGYINVTC